MFGGVPLNLELRLSVEDSPNSAGVAIDMIRCAKIARDRGLAGPILAPAAYFCKHPPQQMPDDHAYNAVEAFIADDQIGRAPVCTPVTNAHPVCRLPLENKNQQVIKR